MCEKKKSCGLCSHYGALANQGMWWCNAGHTEDMNPETCGDYDGAYEGTTATSATTIFSKIKVEPYLGANAPKPMAKWKIDRAKKNKKKRKKQRK